MSNIVCKLKCADVRYLMSWARCKNITDLVSVRWGEPQMLVVTSDLFKAMGYARADVRVMQRVGVHPTMEVLDEYPRQVITLKEADRVLRLVDNRISTREISYLRDAIMGEATDIQNSTKCKPEPDGL
jgi:hypothetical protein